MVGGQRQDTRNQIEIFWNTFTSNHVIIPRFISKLPSYYLIYVCHDIRSTKFNILYHIHYGYVTITQTPLTTFRLRNDAFIVSVNVSSCDLYGLFKNVIDAFLRIRRTFDVSVGFYVFHELEYFFFTYRLVWCISQVAFGTQQTNNNKQKNAQLQYKLDRIFQASVA